MDISTLLENFLSYDDAATITEDVSAILSCPVLVVNSAFKVVACAYPPGFDDALFLGTVHRREMSYEFVLLMHSMPGAETGCVYMNVPGSPYLRRFSELRHRGVLLGYLICVDTAGYLRERPDGDYRLIEAVLSKQLIFEYHRSQICTNDAESVLANLLAGAYENEAAFQIQASATFLSGLDGGRIALVTMDGRRDLSAQSAPVEDVLARRFYASHPLVHDECIILFLNDSHDLRLFDALAESYELHVVISDPYEKLFLLPRTYENARRVLDRTKHGSRRVVRAEAYHGALIMERLEDCGALMQSGVAAAAEHDRRHGTEYCLTLFTYILCHHSLQDTCESLSLHRNTVLYRINRLKTDFGLDPDSAAERFNIFISAAMAVYAQDAGRFVEDGGIDKM